MKKEFWQNFPKPMIGLAPMDGYSDSAFRRVCKSVNPNIITYTEFTSADGLFHSPQRVAKKLAFDVSEQPVIAQIFGKNTETFVAAAKFCEDMGFAGIDLNMGCPAKNVVQSEHGVALRRNHDLAFALIEAVAKNTNLPVSVKTRLGWSDDSDLIPFSVGAQNAGANMICIHARTYKEPYQVAAKFEPVYAMKAAVSIPVLGNGGIISIPDGLTKLGNLDGFLIGQATFGNPWIFGRYCEIAHLHNFRPTHLALLNHVDRKIANPNYLATSRLQETNHCATVPFDINPPPTFEEKLPLILQHARWLFEDKGEKTGSHEIRKHLLAYVKSIPNAKTYRSELCHVSTYDEIESVLKKVLQETKP